MSSPKLEEAREELEDVLRFRFSSSNNRVSSVDLEELEQNWQPQFWKDDRKVVGEGELEELALQRVQ